MRRVKCDEQRPKCKRCISAGWDCTGYSAEVRPKLESNIQIYNIPFKIPGSRTDRELLHFYCCEAAQCLSRFSDSTLWTQLILQRSQHQPVIRNSLVALSSLYREYLKVGSNQLGNSPKTIQLMAKSHKQLSTYLLTPGASPEAALVCSLIFYVFECLVGNTKQAIWHLDRGLELLKNYWVDDPYLLAKMDPIYPQLKIIFCHLDVHASIFLWERLPVLKLASQDHISGLSDVVPEGFSGIFDIEQALVILQNWKTNHLMSTVAHKGVNLQELPIEIAQERLQLERQLQLFEVAIERFRLQNNGQTMNSQDRERIMLLHCQALIFHGVLLENIILTEEDTKTPMEAYCKFEFALEQISFLFSDFESSNGSKSEHRAFTVSTNVVAMLYFVCFKTTDRNLLEKALFMMNSSLYSARDGLWDSRKAFLVVQSVLSEKNSLHSEEEADMRLEDVGSDVIDTNCGLDEVFCALSIEDEVD
ncbi:hypothetical protein N7481_003371 [Penicillium waksmanii]|uniref:uncharacterized protein n=1 Tax=Penicillium waksmanii TaxID=69791 RepID=UPI002549B387|nr:uncharacterized protein N7481_003371 [Penicillium waksmanii]KAJ5988161.1 hypothetical protein N7481_003371 [Penicillium waksmanii]